MRDAKIFLAFCTPKPLAVSQVSELRAVQMVSKGKFSSGYATEESISFSQVQDYFSSIPADIAITEGRGVSGAGFTKMGASAIITLSKLCCAFIQTALVDYKLIAGIEKQSEAGLEELPIEDDEDVAKPTLLPNDDDKLSVHMPKAQRTALKFGPNADVDWVVGTFSDNAERMINLEDVPEKTSHLIRYIPGAVPADKEFVDGVMLDCFGHLLGKDIGSQMKRIESITEHLPQISRHPHGKELLHILASIHIAKSLYSFVNVIIDGVGNVMGTQIVTNFPIIMQGNVREPTAEKDIAEAIKSWMGTSEARDIIASSISSKPLLDGDSETIYSVDIPNPRAVLDHLVKRAPFISISPDLRSAIRLSGYGYEWKTKTKESVTSCLTRIFGKELPDDFYLNEEVFTAQDRCLVSNLSVFGPQSISFMNVGGKVIPLYANAKEDPLQGKKKEVVKESLIIPGRKGKKAVKNTTEKVLCWERLCISSVPIADAYKDFEVMVLSKRVHQMQMYDTKILGNVKIFALDPVDSLMEALRKFGGSKSELSKRKLDVEDEGARKRRSPSDDGEGGVPVEF